MESIHDEPGAFDPDVDLESEESRVRFSIGDDAQATWAMRRLSSVQQRAAQVSMIAEAERSRIDAWEDRQMKQFQRDENYFQGLLMEYAASERTAHDRKSIDTPYGSVKSRVSQPVWEVDADAFLQWAKTHAPDLIRVKETPSLSDMKKFLQIEHTDTLGLVAMTPDGEIVPGVDIHPATVNYTVEVMK